MSTVTQYTLRRLTPADKEVVTPLLVREWGAVEKARRIKPEIPSHGLDGIPVHDEIELTMELP